MNETLQDLYARRQELYTFYRQGNLCREEYYDRIGELDRTIDRLEMGIMTHSAAWERRFSPPDRRRKSDRDRSDRHRSSETHPSGGR